MKRALTRTAGLTILGATIAAGLAFAQSEGSANGPGGRSDQLRPPNQPATPTTPDASDRNAVPGITPARPQASAPGSTSNGGSPSGSGGGTNSGGTTGTPGGAATSPGSGSTDGMNSGSPATRATGTAADPSSRARASRTPRADRN